jgi:hypothetical protein
MKCECLYCKHEDSPNESPCDECKGTRTCKFEPIEGENNDESANYKI